MGHTFWIPFSSNNKFWIQVVDRSNVSRFFLNGFNLKWNLFFVWWMFDKCGWNRSKFMRSAKQNQIENVMKIQMRSISVFFGHRILEKNWGKRARLKVRERGGRWQEEKEKEGASKTLTQNKNVYLSTKKTLRRWHLKWKKNVSNNKSSSLCSIYFVKLELRTSV